MFSTTLYHVLTVSIAALWMIGLPVTWDMNPISRQPGFQQSPPDNDSFFLFRSITGSSGYDKGTNQRATKDSWEGGYSHGYNYGGASVWWRWTAPTTGAYVFDTSGSSFNTLLAIYTWPGNTGLLIIAAQNDDDIENLSLQTSRVTLQATANTEYIIAVDGYNNGWGASTGSIVLNWRPKEAIPTPSPKPDIYTMADPVAAPVSIDGGLSEITSRPDDVQRQVEGPGGSPLTPACLHGEGVLTWGRNIVLKDKEKPARIEICFSRFPDGWVTFQIIEPGYRTRTPQPSQIYISKNSGNRWVYYLPTEDPIGKYVLKVTQGKTITTATFNVINPSGPRLLVDPAETGPGTKIMFYTAGFPARTRVRFSLYRGEACPGKYESNTRTCYQFRRTIQFTTNAFGGGVFELPTRNTDSHGSYLLRTRPANGNFLEAYFRIY